MVKPLQPVKNGGGFTHGKKSGLDVGDAAYQDQLLFTQTAILKNTDKDVHIV